MSVIVAQPHYIFGLRSSVINNICYFDEQTIIFPAGNNCIKYNMYEKWQKFIPDSKYLVAQSGFPEWQMVFWMWEKHRVMATVRIDSHKNSIYKVSFNPYDSTQICVTANRIFRLFHYIEGNLKQINSQKVGAHNFLCHTWLSTDRVICGTDNGKLCLWEFGLVRWEHNISGEDIQHSLAEKQSLTKDSRTLSTMNSAYPPPVCIHAIVAYSKGFLCTGGPGIVCIFEKVDDEQLYKRGHNIQIPQNEHTDDPRVPEQQEVLCVCLSPSEENIVISTNKSQLYSIALSSAEITKLNDAHFEFLTESWHSSAITGLSVCIRKPLIATCSVDHSVRIWNFENRTLELCKHYQEEAYSISLHPSGLYILVGFSDKLCLMNLLVDDIRPFKEFIVRGCRECVFSHGGHLFAAVNGNVIQIYSAITFENVTNLKGHSGRVRSVVWSTDDSKLVSCGLEGAVYEWNLLTGKRESECVLRHCSYSCVALSPDSKTIFAVGSDQTLKEISDSQILQEVPAFDVTYTAVAISHSGRMVFTGTSSGTVRSMKCPLPLHRGYNEYQAHAGPVTRLMVTFDDQYLLSTSEDGCLMLWKISDKEVRGLKYNKVEYAEEVLTTISDLEEKKQLILELKTNVKELKMENDYQLRVKDMNYNEKLKELTEKFLQEIEVLKTANQILKAEAEKEELKHQEEISHLTEKQYREMQDLEMAAHQKLLLAYEKHQDFQVKSQQMHEDDQRQMHELEESKTQALEELTKYYEAKIHETESQLQHTQEEAQQQLRKFEETIKQIEEDGDGEIEDIKKKYKWRLQAERETLLNLKGENRTMKKKFNSLQEEIEERVTDTERMKVEQQKLIDIIKSLQKDILGLEREIQGRDEAIQDKGKIIIDLNKKKEKLENCRFVLNNKIKELEKQNEPWKNEINQMKEQIQEMETELQHFHKQNTQLDLINAELKQKLNAEHREMQKERQKVRNIEAIIKRFKVDLHHCVGLIQEPKQLKNAIRKLYTKYGQDGDAVEMIAIDADIQQEYAGQREHLERRVSTLQGKLLKDTEIHHSANLRFMQENIILIKEINEYRHELKVSRSKVYNLEVELGLYRKNKKSCLTEPKGSSVSSQGCPELQRLNSEEEVGKILELQKLEIKRLRDLIQSQDLTVGVRQYFGGKLLPLQPDHTKLKIN
ncbi:cilia- and flagella-associated protein 57-like isoform X2 [Pseudophryne corroboree]|uniref:cilia- and flagella-associated protein 57-like isoform X2 n=1 Tax=Pseudophryne corroboree TaxID=495146 RepID=UPI0030814CC4